MPSLEGHSECEHLKVSEQWMTENGCGARMIFLCVPLFLDSLKELLAAVGGNACESETNM
jgi:hypothetical protein